MVKKFGLPPVLIFVVTLGCQSTAGVGFPKSPPAGLVVGTGASSQKDPQTAAVEAARQALRTLGPTKPKLVLVFDQADAPEAVLKGVNSVADPGIVFGCVAYSPLTEEGNNPTVGVLALGGDVEVQSAMAALGGGHEKCGREIARQIKPAAPGDKRPGELMILFGTCHVPADDQLVAGVRAELGDKFPVVGASASKSMTVYHQGRAMKDINVGVVIRGDFLCHFAMKEGDNKEKLVDSAREAVAQVCAPPAGNAPARPGAVALVLVFDCGGRRASLGEKLPVEFDGMKTAAGGAKMFGFYGSGEIGPSDNSSPSRGVGFHIVSCAIWPVVSAKQAP
jgi:hypothetical protein